MKIFYLLFEGEILQPITFYLQMGQGIQEWIK